MAPTKNSLEKAMFELIRIATQGEADAEGTALKHSIGFVFQSLEKDGVMFYSVRENGAPVFTLSVKHDAQDVYYCDHILGLHSRQPTEAELTTIASLLLLHKVELRYAPEMAH
jgi:hypothetical protein